MIRHNTLAGVLVRRLGSWSTGLWFESLCCPPRTVFKEYLDMFFKVVRKNISQKINRNINSCRMRVPVPSCSRNMISGQNLTGAREKGHKPLREKMSSLPNSATFSYDRKDPAETKNYLHKLLSSRANLNPMDVFFESAHEILSISYISSQKSEQKTQKSSSGKFPWDCNF